jgi:hypothetical protein
MHYLRDIVIWTHATVAMYILVAFIHIGTSDADGHGNFRLANLALNFFNENTMLPVTDNSLGI